MIGYSESEENRDRNEERKANEGPSAPAFGMRPHGKRPAPSRQLPLMQPNGFRMGDRLGDASGKGGDDA